MKINRTNYESFFLNYIEKKLQPEEVAELMIFMEQNPDLKTEFDGIENVILKPDELILLKHKDQLKKREYKSTEYINPWNYEEKMIALLEGELAEHEAEDLKIFMSLNPLSKLELNFFRQTYLKPENITYPDKGQLKKRGVILFFQPSLRYVASVAAILALFFGLYLVFDRDQITPTLQSEIIPETPAEQEPEIAIAVTDHFNAGQEMIHQNKKIGSVNEVKDPGMIISPPIDKFPARNWQGNLTATMEITPVEKRSFYSDHLVFDAETDSRSSFAGRFIRAFSARMIRQPDMLNKSLVEYTIDGYNLLADRQVEINKQLDQEGNVVAFNIRGENISFFRSLKESQ
jgi:hypothetical protein